MTQTQYIKLKLQLFQNLIQKNKLDGFLVTNHLDQFYLTDFMFYPGETVLLVSKKKTVCFTRSLYLEQLKNLTPYMEVIGDDVDRLSHAMKYVKKLGLKAVGFDAAKEAYLTGKMLVKNGCKEMGSFIAQMREQKNAKELKLMRASNQLAYLTYEYIKPRIKTGMTETQVAAEMERFMRAAGASTTSFATIVAFGEGASDPHHVTGERKLKTEECILIDFGCVYKGYCSDMTRSWWHGKKVPAEYTKIWNLVNRARREGIKAVCPGRTGQQVDRVSRSIIEQAGYGDYFTHRTGHGVGIEIHEEPCNSQQCTAKLVEGNVVTVEPGIYLPGKYGVRLEDTVAVSKKGAVILTRK